MAAKTANTKASNGQQKRDSRPGLALPCQPSEEQAVPWTERFAFKFWLACFGLMALMVAYDAIAGILRWIGSS